MHVWFGVWVSQASYLQIMYSIIRAHDAACLTPMAMGRSIDLHEQIQGGIDFLKIIGEGFYQKHGGNLGGGFIF